MTKAERFFERMKVRSNSNKKTSLQAARMFLLYQDTCKLLADFFAFTCRVGDTEGTAFT